MTQSNSTRRLVKADFKVPALLILLSIVPTFGAIVRVMSVAHDTTITPDNARFLHAPAPVVIHVFCATIFSVVGAFQFSRGFRLRWPRWHRRAGKVLGLCGIGAGATGLGMTVFYDIPSSLQGPLLYGVRVGVALAMIGAIVIAWRSILRRDVSRHEAFMIRAYALGQGAGTQVLVLLPWMMISGESGGMTRDVLMTLSWAINVVVAEAIIKRRARATRQTGPMQGPRGFSMPEVRSAP